MDYGYMYFESSIHISDCKFPVVTTLVSVDVGNRKPYEEVNVRSIRDGELHDS